MNADPNMINDHQNGYPIGNPFRVDWKYNPNL
jgi:hypothetical protein